MPPFTVASFATTMHSTPFTRPMPVMMPGRRGLVLVHAERGELPELEERRARIEQPVDAVAREELAARDVLVARRLAAALGHLARLRAQVLDERSHRRRVGLELGRAGLDLGLEDVHQALSENSSRPISMRRISEVPAPISYSFASRHSRPVGYSLM